MQRKQLAVTGVFTAAAAALVAVGIALSGSQPTEQPDTTPAGQVDDLPDSTAPSTSSASTTAPATPSTESVPQNAPVADDEPVNAPAPQEDVPPPGVPYDSDGGVVVPNPPDLGPGEVAPLPPTQTGPPPPEQVPGVPTVPVDAP